MKRIYLATFLFGLFLFLGAGEANAATLFLSPSSGSYQVGSSFSVSVLVNSSSQAMNASSGTISFPSDKLKITSISKAGSIINLWVQEPSFSNSAGTARFEGIALTPGYTGSSGKLVTLQFTVLAQGAGSITFSQSSVLANDGEGSDILTSSGSANFTFIKSSVVPPLVVPPAVNSEAISLLYIPTIVSPTHPNSNAWYSNSNPRFVWTSPKDVDSVRILYDKFPLTNPTMLYKEPISDKQLSDIGDGVWYFHVQLHSPSGWAEVAHFKFQIDTQKPDHFEMKEIAKADTTEPNAKFIFDALDKTSGIDRYQVQIDNQESQLWKDDGSHIYETPLVAPGPHTIIAQAIDKAGNALSGSVTFSVDPLVAPVFTQWPRQLQEGQRLVATGKSAYANSTVEIWSRSNNQEEKSSIVVTDSTGNFTFSDEENINSGVYVLWARSLDLRGAKSYPTEKLIITVQPLTLLQRFLAMGQWFKAIFWLALIIFLLLYLLYLIWFAFSRRSKKTKNY